MRPKPPPLYLAGYPVELTEKIKQMIEHNLLADWLLRKYPHSHPVRSDKALYDYVVELKNTYLETTGKPLWSPAQLALRKSVQEAEVHEACVAQPMNSKSLAP